MRLPRRPETWVVLAAALLGALGAWWLTTPRLLAMINWDQAVYIVLYATKKLTWSSAPWNAHFAIGHLYWLGAKMVHPLGGTPVDGFRLVNAIAYGAASGLMADALLRLQKNLTISFLLAAIWMTSWVNLFLILSLEDNILYLPFAIAVIRECASNADEWSAKASLRAGLFAACAALMSWQALLYFAPAFYCALVTGPRARAAGNRIQAAAALLAGFVATLVGWCVLVGATSSLGVGQLLESMFSRPSGNFSLRSPGEVTDLLGVLGNAAGYLIRHDFSYSYWPKPLFFKQPHTTGALFFAAIIVVLLLATWVSIRRRGWTAHVLAATIALFVLITPFYKDVVFRYLIRFDFLPLVAVPLVAELLPELHHTVGKSLLAAGLAAIVVAQFALAIQWDRARHASYPTLPSYQPLPHPEASWYGREGKSWVQYFRDIRKQNPNACRYVFDLHEIWEASWQFDIIASLWSELPDHLVLGDAATSDRWRYPPRALSPSLAAQKGLVTAGCAWLSADARRLLSTNK